MTHKEITAKIRAEVKAAGIKAQVRMYTACGIQWVQVFARFKKGETFTTDQQVTINRIAKQNGLHHGKAGEIDINQPFGELSNYVY